MFIQYREQAVVFFFENDGRLYKDNITRKCSNGFGQRIVVGVL